ncbi:MAG: alpha/beta hydrolase [Rhodobacteraceae bacterium]|nr:alpha/beta hydrolase [Paracoccaceae bacterium]
MRSHRVAGAGGVMLHVTDQGPPDAPALLLIHGWSQDSNCWQAQAPLADRYRLVAFDLRGHGASDAPQIAGAYTDGALWAGDVAAVIAALDLHRPILVGWSYGSRVIAAYLDVFGDANIAGVVLVGGILTIGKERRDWMVGPGSPGLNPDLYTDDDARRLAATEAFVRTCTEEPLDDALTADIIALNMGVTALVRRALFAANWDFQPVYAALNVPLLAIHGVEDRIVAPLTGITASELAPLGDLRLYEHCGHTPFLEAPERFNTDLAEFTETNAGAAE